MTPARATHTATRAPITAFGATLALLDGTRDGLTGLLVPPRDPLVLAQRLARQQCHPDLACAMGEAGRRRACERHTWRRVATQHEAIYADVLRTVRRVPTVLKVSRIKP